MEGGGGRVGIKMSWMGKKIEKLTIAGGDDYSGLKCKFTLRKFNFWIHFYLTLLYTPQAKSNLQSCTKFLRQTLVFM